MNPKITDTDSSAHGIIFQNSRIIIPLFVQFEIIFDAIAENSGCSEHGETKDTSNSMYRMNTSFYYKL